MSQEPRGATALREPASGGGLVVGILIVTFIVLIGVWYFGFAPDLGLTAPEVQQPLDTPALASPSG